MMIVLLGAGIGVVVAGLVAIGFGIEVREFSLGSTLILAGTVAVCTGLIMLSLSAAVRELRGIALRLGSANQTPEDTRDKSEPSPSVFNDPEPREGSFGDGPLFLRDQPAPPSAAAADSAATPWQEEAARGRTRQRGNNTAAAEPAPEAKPRRNLLFSSSRKERDRSAADDLNSANPVARPPTAPGRFPEAGPSASFEDAWPPLEPTRSDSFRRSARAPSTFNDANAGAPARADDRSQVTVLKSGVVDGMAYSLYSDGSIEAQMPEGMMRFASIGELRAHLDQRL